MRSWKHSPHFKVSSSALTADRDEWTSWQAEGWDKHSLIADPKFVDWKNDDFRLQADSPAFKLGFEAIPVDKIGIRN